MIAANYRKHPQAMALQLPLPFSRLLVWALKRPTTRTLRAIRVARASAFKLAGRISYPVKPTIPQWFKDASRRAQALAQAVKAACIALDFQDETEHFYSNEELKAMHEGKAQTPRFVVNTYKGEKINGQPEILPVKGTQAVLCGGKMIYALHCAGQVLMAGFCRAI